MEPITPESEKAQLIREEFECFVRIGMDAGMRGKILRVLEHRLVVGNPFAAMPSIYFETRDDEGAIREMWYLEADGGQQHRLLEFLRRFTIEQVKMIDGMLHRE